MTIMSQLIQFNRPESVYILIHASDIETLNLLVVKILIIMAVIPV